VLLAQALVHDFTHSKSTCLIRPMDRVFAQVKWGF